MSPESCAGINTRSRAERCTEGIGVSRRDKSTLASSGSSLGTSASSRISFSPWKEPLSDPPVPAETKSHSGNPSSSPLSMSASWDGSDCTSSAIGWTVAKSDFASLSFPFLSSSAAFTMSGWSFSNPVGLTCGAIVRAHKVLTLRTPSDASLASGFAKYRQKVVFHKGSRISESQTQMKTMRSRKLYPALAVSFRRAKARMCMRSRLERSLSSVGPPGAPSRA
mmetsp:Transcript_56451/g.150384  ORF Transcript_56451/g.150384 Transcript_56451/m.150384 type:complete len:223 (-) Transcript_56451:1034-1702(-)